MSQDVGKFRCRIVHVSFHTEQNCSALKPVEGEMESSCCKFKSRSTCTDRQSLQPERCHNTNWSTERLRSEQEHIYQWRGSRPHKIDHTWEAKFIYNHQDDHPFTVRVQ